MSPRLLQFVAQPMITFVPVDPPTLPDRWNEQKYEVLLRLFGIIPFGRQTIDISIPSLSNVHIELRDNGYGNLIQKWDHLITIKAIDGGSLYSDRVEVKAGLLTPFIWAFAWLFYRHRQRRWQRLVRSGFEHALPN